MINPQWEYAKKNLTDEILSLGFPKELADEIARNLGSPKAMQRMTAYLQYVKPNKVELVVDEMLAICSDIDAWRNKKDSEQANAAYNELLNSGLGTDE